jgi:Cu/Zn superoxide dismutase
LKAEDDERTRVTIDLSNAPDAAQPAHIHERPCEDIDPQPTDTLQPVANGHSETVINVSLNHLRSSPHAVNVHKSTDALDEYVACGTIGEGGSLLP